MNPSPSRACACNRCTAAGDTKFSTKQTCVHSDLSGEQCVQTLSPRSFPLRGFRLSSLADSCLPLGFLSRLRFGQFGIRPVAVARSLPREDRESLRRKERGRNVKTPCLASQGERRYFLLGLWVFGAVSVQKRDRPHQWFVRVPGQPRRHQGLTTLLGHTTSVPSASRVIMRRPRRGAGGTGVHRLSQDVP